MLCKLGDFLYAMLSRLNMKFCISCNEVSLDLKLKRFEISKVRLVISSSIPPAGIIGLVV